MDSIIRSLRFGTSMAETLSSAGSEIRATRKTKLEERVAKAPVKMLIPIGTLILPAMLIFILGPVILELIGGF
jgi:tight adherence protein C